MVNLLETSLKQNTSLMSQRGGANLEAAGDGNDWGPDDCSMDANTKCFGGGGLFSHPPSIITNPWMEMAGTMGISGIVIGVSR